VLRKGTSVIVHKTLGIEEPDAFASLILWETLELEEAQQLLGHTNTGGSSSEKEDPLFLGRQTGGSSGKFRRVDETGQNDGPRAWL